MELVVVVSASEKQEAIAQSRSHGLTGTDIYIYMQQDYLPRFIARQLFQIAVL